MIVQHKNSREYFDLSTLCYTKLFGMYGLLVMLVNQEIYFIAQSEGLDCNYEITEEFEIITL
jgi:hypothetical protein